MNIITYISSYTLPIVKERILPLLTVQQKKIFLIASLAFSFLAACYLIKRFCFSSQLLKVAIRDREDISHLPRNLVALDLSNCRSGPGLKHFQDLPKGLKEIKITMQFPVEWLKDFPKDLRHLDLRSCNLLGVNATTFKDLFPNLEVLNLAYTKNLTNEVIKNLPKGLKKLYLSECNDLTDAAIKDLPPNLEVLALAYCHQLTPAALKDLPKSLKELDLSRKHNLTDAAMKDLPPNLEILDLSHNSNLTDAVIKDLPKGLKKLYLAGCNNLTDAAIKDLPPNLEILDLTACPNVTDAAMKDLPKSLKEFYHS